MPVNRAFQHYVSSYKYKNPQPSKLGVIGSNPIRITEVKVKRLVQQWFQAFFIFWFKQGLNIRVVATDGYI